MRPLILATAGHIDHGKTALVQALTGVDTDRLPEEKQRGITIDLGFANLRLGDVALGVIDVPGHEGFIRNMLAGATGMDVVLLVIAADEGVMPQTREHLAILDLLGVRNGVVAITKIDVVSSEWLELVADDVRQLLRPTTLCSAPIVRVSARTGAGLDELRTVLAREATGPAQRRADDLLRMPVDRVFTLRGTGTVVTGTIWSGTVRVDQMVTLGPAGGQARVRGIQVYGQALETGRAGERAALALAGVARDAVSRGAVVVGSATWQSVNMLTLRARLIPDSTWRLATRQRVRVHAGTAEVLARAHLLAAESIGPGESGWLQLRLERPLVTRVGDRVILRSYSPVTTIGGGVVAELSGRKRTRLDPDMGEALERVLGADPAASVAAVLKLRGTQGATVSELAIATPHALPDVESALVTLGARVVQIGHRLVARSVVEGVVKQVIERAHSLHAAHPLRPMVERAEIRSSIRHAPPEVVDYAIDMALRTGAFHAAGGSIALREFTPVLSESQRSTQQALLRVLKAEGIAAPTVAELSRSFGSAAEIEELLRLLEHQGAVRAISRELYLESEALIDAQRRTTDRFGGTGGLSVSEFRTTLPVSRKHLIPLLEYFDRTGITVRDGDLRMVVGTSEAG